MMKRTWVAAATVAVLLTACGGGDDDDTPPPTQSVPADVSTSSTSFISYLRALIASAADTLEPVDVSMVTPATDNTVEPTPID
jgi:hypothetical protein